MTLADFYAHARLCGLRMHYGCVRDDAGRDPITAVARRVLGAEFDAAAKAAGASTGRLAERIGLGDEDARLVIGATYGCKGRKFAPVREALVGLTPKQ